MEYFILGILTVLLFIPLIEGICSLGLTIIEAIKGYFSVKIAKYNQQLRENSDVKLMNQIGFVYEEDQEEEEDD